MDIRIFDTAEDTALAVAQRVADSLRRQPELVLGVPAGRTPLGAYHELRRMHAAGATDFSRATAFTVDEFAGIPRTHSSSFLHFLSESLFTGVNIPANRIHSLDGAATNFDDECERYEAELGRAGGVDLQLLGIGRNGHIGFNEPGESLMARTHRVTLLAATRGDNAGRFGGDASRVPMEALTIGIGTILSAEAVLLIASGANKAHAVERMIRGPVTTRVPASFLQLHRRVEVYLDREAASAL